MVNAIRGKAGGKVTLTILRDATIVTSTLERQKIAFDSVSQELLPGGIGLLSIRSFNETTPQGTREALAALKGARGLIIDLRDNEGGLLERSLDTAKTAAALRENLHAPLIGTKTFGKWSVQVIKELPNKFVMRYTVATFRAPDGKAYEGEGLPPDIEVDRDEAALADGKKPTEQNDAQ